MSCFKLLSVWWYRLLGIDRELIHTPSGFVVSTATFLLSWILPLPLVFLLVVPLLKAATDSPKSGLLARTEIFLRGGEGVEYSHTQFTALLCHSLNVFHSKMCVP